MMNFNDRDQVAILAGWSSSFDEQKPNSVDSNCSIYANCGSQLHLSVDLDGTNPSHSSSSAVDVTSTTIGCSFSSPSSSLPVQYTDHPMELDWPSNLSKSNDHDVSMQKLKKSHDENELDLDDRLVESEHVYME